MHNYCSLPYKTQGLCPECNKKGKKVQRLTMEHLLQPSLTGEIASGQYFFCESPSCQVVYFSAAGGKGKERCINVQSPATPGRCANGQEDCTLQPAGLNVL